MTFDRFAAGLLTIGYGIEHGQEREPFDAAAETKPFGDFNAGPALLSALDADRPRLAQLSQTAWNAAHYNCAEVWYSKRAEWNFSAYDV